MSKAVNEAESLRVQIDEENVGMYYTIKGMVRSKMIIQVKIALSIIRIIHFTQS